MKVAELMTRDVAVCGPNDSMNRAVQLMWERDCGCVPVLDADRRVLGMITDRDVCMASYTRGVPLSASPVAQAMSRRVYACTPNDDVHTALEKMAERQLHRLPVLDDERRLVGLLSLADVLQAVGRSGGGTRKKLQRDVCETLVAVTTPRARRSAEPSAEKPRALAGAAS